jgi:glycosyltransferase involved in cell wall biosynthesis
MITTLNIIVPCYNPPNAWAAHLCQQYQAFTAGTATPIIQLILVNDGSNKGISEKDLSFLQSQIPTIQIVSYETNRGKGYALRQGVAASKADLYIFTDIDFPYTLDSMWAMERALHERGNIAAGYRNRTYYEHVPAWRKGLSWAFRGFIRA